MTEMTATQRLVRELLEAGVPMATIEEGIRIAAKKVAADMVAGTGEFAPISETQP